MSIPVNNADIMHYTQLFKGNWVKGVNNLKYIMQQSRTAQEFVDNGNGLQCIYGVVDRNSQELIEVIEYYGFGDKAATRYLNLFFDWSYANMTAVAASSTAMTAVNSSAIALNRIIKISDARTRWNNSTYRANAISTLLARIQDTTYFTVRLSNQAWSSLQSWNTSYYQNGATYTESNVTTLSADASIAYFMYRTHSGQSTYSCLINSLQTNVNLVNAGVSSFAGPIAFMGGMRHQNLNTQSMYVSTPK